MHIVRRSFSLGIASAFGLLVGCVTDPLTIGQMLTSSTCESTGGTCTAAALCQSGTSFVTTETCAVATVTCCHPCAIVDVPTCGVNEVAVANPDALGCPETYDCQISDGGLDAGGSFDGGPDAGFDADINDAGPVTCASAGGTCVPVLPGACDGGTINAGLSCSGGIGSSCCLP